jgi:alanine racemase
VSESRCRPTRVEIDLASCVHNLEQLRERLPHREIWPVVKADAYGHGAAKISRLFERERVAGFCVATASEGRDLRLAGISLPILVMSGLAGGGDEDPFRMVVEYGLTAGVPDAVTAENLAAAARELAIGPAAVHLKVDTGMGRIGVSVDQAVPLAAALRAEPNISFDGLFSNLATADSYKHDDPGVEMVQAQVQQFREVCTALEKDANLPPVRTLANSAAIAHHPSSWDELPFTGVRPGLALYGATLTPDSPQMQLHPAMRVVTEISAIRRLPEGATVGYGTDSVLRRPTRVAVLPLGYHDGLPRRSGSQAEVLVRGRRAPLLGRISMDISLVDVTDVTAAAPGDPVTVFGEFIRDEEPGRASEETYADSLMAAMGATASDSGAVVGAAGRRRRPPRVEEIAAWAGTIPHEVLCRMGERVPRVYVGPESAAKA